MFKKLSFLIMLIFVAFSASGCIKYTSTINIDSKDYVNFSQIAAIDMKPIREVIPDADLTKEPAWMDAQSELIEQGWKVKRYDNNGFQGFLTFKRLPIRQFKAEDLPKGFSLPQDTPSPFIHEKTPFKSSYKINLRYDPAALTLGYEGNMVTDEDTPKETIQDFRQRAVQVISQNPDKVDLSLTIKIPQRAKSHNATEMVNTREYKWNLATTEPIEINLVYEKINFLSVLFLFAIIFGTLIFITQNKKYIKKEDNDETKSAF